jgi:histone-lysine N-methyltransferase SETMAR
MAENLSSKIFLRRLMFNDFHKNNSAKVATKNICDIYGSKLSVRTCLKWFKKFKSGNLYLDDEPRSGRPKVLDDAVLLTVIESNPELTIQELSERLHCSWSTVQEKNRKGLERRYLVTTPSHRRE